MNNSQPSQSDRILSYLEAGNTLTSIEALKLFNCFRLASRISELRSEGQPIVSDMILTKQTKKKIARYRLSNVQVQTTFMHEAVLEGADY